MSRQPPVEPEPGNGPDRATGPGRKVIPVALDPAPQGQARTFKGWGDVIDPDGDCKVALEAGKLTIAVPGTLHTWGRKSESSTHRPSSAT